MTIQRYQAAFRSIDANISPWNVVPLTLEDPPAYPIQTNPGWTSGASLIDVIQLIPPANQQWQLNQITISGELILSTDAPIYGKLGKILAGLATMMSPTNGAKYGSFVPAAIPGIQLPGDQTAIGALWDPATDALPPSQPTADANTPPPTLPVSLTISPPSPIVMDQSETIGIGLWMLPSLIGQYPTLAGFGLLLLSGIYALVYDDGVTPPTYV